MPSGDAATALRRFGLGPKPGDLKRVASDPRGFVLQQLADKNAAQIDDPGLATTAIALVTVRDAVREKKAEKMAAGEAPSQGTTANGQPMMKKEAAAPQAGAASAGVTKPGQVRREYFREDAIARINRARTTDAGLVERLVMFWSNHFCVSVAKGQVRAVAGSFERDAIRPHVLGRFSDMLKAVEQHPAMLIYLDQVNSIGPNSMAGQRRAKGINENLAREILELHTLGVNGGYTQADVGNLARILTGWSVANDKQERAEPGTFVFASRRHEPGTFQVQGKSYSDTGLSAGETCLADLARHPSTARHIARKIAGHFVAEAASADLAARLEKTFRESDGDLQAVTRALISSPEAWSVPPRKILPPYDFAISVQRAFALTPPPPEIVRLTGALGQPLWQPPAPAGWPDQDDAWIGPSAIRERLRVAEKAAREISRDADPRVLASDLLGDAARAETMQAIQRAESREQGFQLLIMSPEFLRR